MSLNKPYEDHAEKMDHPVDMQFQSHEQDVEIGYSSRVNISKEIAESQSKNFDRLFKEHQKMALPGKESLYSPLSHRNTLSALVDHENYGLANHQRRRYIRSNLVYLLFEVAMVSLCSVIIHIYGDDD
jgi:hypothetical protein